MVYALPVTKLDYGSTKRGKASGTWDFLIARTRIHRDVCTLRTSRLWKIDVIFERAATKFFWTMTRVEMIQLNWLTSSFFSWCEFCNLYRKEDTMLLKVGNCRRVIRILLWFFVHISEGKYKIVKDVYVINFCGPSSSHVWVITTF